MVLKRMIAATVFCLPLWASAQSKPPADSVAPPAKAAAASSPALDFSGILFANYQYRADQAQKGQNRFDVERAYLTFRMSAGKRTSVRVTTDLFQQTNPANDAYYRGWTIRAKYAYLQYNYLETPDWKANARIGLLHTVFIDHDEQFWPRWIAPSPTERAVYFASADGGLATTVGLPNKAGEVYATITNGPGYTSRETDRFKDYAARLTLTPWAKNASSPLKTVALTAWGYKGAIASRFVSGGTGQTGTVGEGLVRNRWGVHAGSATPRFTLGLEFASKHDEGETGLNTVASPRAVTDSTGTVASVYTLLRPVMLLSDSKSHPLSLMVRYDRVVTNTDTDARYLVWIAGVIWDISSKASFSLDYQESTSYGGTSVAESKTYFAHFVARF